MLDIIMKSDISTKLTSQTSTIIFPSHEIIYYGKSKQANMGN